MHVAEANDGSVYVARLQSSFVNAFAELRPSRLPVLKAIVTTPLVALNGQIVAQQGFDRGSGIWFELGPAELAALPPKVPDDEAIAAAYRFLRDELLIDVATEETGKAVTVALLGTIMHVPLLPERPAFFVTAPQRGGGKTTLLHLLSHVVFGRSASAAARSEQREERRKTMFAVASEGHRMVLFDNIPRGGRDLVSGDREAVDQRGDHRPGAWREPDRHCVGADRKLLHRQQYRAGRRHGEPVAQDPP